MGGLAGRGASSFPQRFHNGKVAGCIRGEVGYTGGPDAERSDESCGLLTGRGRLHSHTLGGKHVPRLWGFSPRPTSPERQRRVFAVRWCRRLTNAGLCAPSLVRAGVPYLSEFSYVSHPFISERMAHPHPSGPRGEFGQAHGLQSVGFDGVGGGARALSFQARGTALPVGVNLPSAVSRRRAAPPRPCVVADRVWDRRCAVRPA